MKRKAIRAIIVIFGLVALFAYVFITEGIAGLEDKLAAADYRFIALGVLCMAASVVADGLAIHIVRTVFQPGASPLNSVRCSLIATALGYVTPFQTGYLAGAITCLTSDGLRASEASAVTLKKQIYYTGAAIVTNILLLVFNARLFELPPVISVLAAAGIALAGLYMVFLMLVARFEKTITAVACGLIRFGGKLRFIRNPDGTGEKAREEIRSLKARLSAVRLAPWRAALLFVCCAAAFLSLYFISWFIYLGFCGGGLPVRFVITGNAICQIIQQISPIPGGIGIVDAAYTRIMSSIYGTDLNVAMLIWRMISLYLVILCGLTAAGLGAKRTGGDGKVLPENKKDGETMETVFTKIIKGEIPSTKLYEDDICIVILDINPVAKGHALVISKAVTATTAETDDAVLTHMILVAKKLDGVMRAALGCDATNLMINNGPASGQEVPQLHIHVIPRYNGDGIRTALPHTSYSDGEMASYGERLRFTL